MSNQSLWSSVKSSFMDSVGDFVFGMEDGAVSIAGLVFGVAFSVNNNTPVILAGATGATAAAISMAAGAYLDVESRKGLARKKIQHEKSEVENNPASEISEERQRFRFSSSPLRQPGSWLSSPRHFCCSSSVSGAASSPVPTSGSLPSKRLPSRQRRLSAAS